MGNAADTPNRHGDLLNATGPGVKIQSSPSQRPWMRTVVYCLVLAALVPAFFVTKSYENQITSEVGRYSGSIIWHFMTEFIPVMFCALLIYALFERKAIAE